MPTPTSETSRSKALRRVAVGFVALALALAACGDDDDDKKTDRSGGGAGQGSAVKSGLTLGDETTLKGLKGVEVSARALQVEDPLTVPAKGLSQERPKAGRRFVAVHVRITNTGKKAYSDVPLNGSRLVTDVAKAANGTILLTGKCRTKKFATRLRLAPGASRKGCLPFQVKRGAKIKAFQLRLDSGFGPDTGVWTVR